MTNPVTFFEWAIENNYGLTATLVKEIKRFHGMPDIEIELSEQGYAFDPSLELWLKDGYDSRGGKKNGK